MARAATLMTGHWQEQAHAIDLAKG